MMTFGSVKQVEADKNSLSLIAVCMLFMSLESSSTDITTLIWQGVPLRETTFELDARYLTYNGMLIFQS